MSVYFIVRLQTPRHLKKKEKKLTIRLQKVTLKLFEPIIGLEVNDWLNDFFA